MSKQIARAYTEFLKQEKKRQAKMKNMMSASSTGLLARRSPAKSNDTDQTDTLIGIVNEIRKYGGSNNG
jgi:hypothetical protein